MRLIFIGIFVGLFFLTPFAENKISKKEKKEVTNLLNQQIEAWNNGDIEQFMETYWNSEKLVFVGSRGPTYGWQATLANYKKGYPDKAAMGKLDFKILKISKIDKKSIFVIGRFELTREKDDLAGHFTLLMQKIKGKWLIVSDHSSSEN